MPLKQFKVLSQNFSMLRGMLKKKTQQKQRSYVHINIKVINAMYEINTAAVEVGNEVSNWFCMKSGVKQGYVLSSSYGSFWLILS